MKHRLIDILPLAIFLANLTAFDSSPNTSQKPCLVFWRANSGNGGSSRNTMNLIKSENSDLDEIFILYRSAADLMRDKAVVTVWPEFDREMVISELLEGRQWKGVIDGKSACVWAVGYSDPQIWGERDADPSVYIHRIATRPEFRGKGLVSKIVDWARDHAKSKNLKYIRMDTVGENHGLISHYRKHGFDFLGLSKLGDTAGLPAHYHNATVSLFQIELEQ